MHARTYDFRGSYEHNYKRGRGLQKEERMLSLRDPGASVTIFVLCSCIIFSLPDYTQTQKFKKADKSFGGVRQVTTPASPPDDLLLLYQIDRDIRSYSYEDVNDILSYEDDTLPYALAEKSGQNNEHSIRVIKENLKKVKGYLEREREKKEKATKSGSHAESCGCSPSPCASSGCHLLHIHPIQDKGS